MQFNLTDGPPSTWQRYAVDGNGDGRSDVYDPEDAIPSAARYLHALLDAADGDLRRAILGYNHSPAYVTAVLTHARDYARAPVDELTAPVGDCTGDGIDGPPGPAELATAERVSAARAYRALPAWAMAAGSPRTCRGDCPAHVHVSWRSPCYGSAALVSRCGWVAVFPVSLDNTGLQG
jgi:hypothetical protein